MLDRLRSLGSPRSSRRPMRIILFKVIDDIRNHRLSFPVRASASRSGEHTANIAHYAPLPVVPKNIHNEYFAVEMAERIGGIDQLNFLNTSRPFGFHHRLLSVACGMHVRPWAPPPTSHTPVALITCGVFLYPFHLGRPMLIWPCVLWMFEVPHLRANYKWACHKSSCIALYR